MDDRVHGVRVHLDAVCVVVTENVSCIFNNRQLHAEAEAEERNLVLSCISNRCDHAFDTAVSESARYQNTVHIAQILCHVLLGYQLGIHPFQVYVCMACNSAVF